MMLRQTLMREAARRAKSEFYQEQSWNSGQKKAAIAIVGEQFSAAMYDAMQNHLHVNEHGEIEGIATARDAALRQVCDWAHK